MESEGREGNVGSRLLWVALILAVLAIAAGFRLYGLSTQGLGDMDGTFFYTFLHLWLPEHSLLAHGPNPLSYMAGRPSFVWTLFAESLLFQPTVYMELLHSAVCGILAVGLLILVGEKYVARGVGILGGLILGVSYMAVFLSRHPRDGAHTFLFFLLGALLLLVALRRRKAWLFLLAGLVTSFAATSNYIGVANVIAMLAALVAVQAYDLIRRNATLKETASGFVAYGIGLAVFPIVFELFHPIISFYFPFWEQIHGWGYFAGFFYSANVHAAGDAGGQFGYQAGGFPYYLGVFWRQGWWMAVPAAAGLVLALARKRYRTRAIFLFAALLIVPIIVHSLTRKVADLERNTWLCFGAYALFAGIGWAELIRFMSAGVARASKRVQPSTVAGFATPVVMAVIVAAAFPSAKPAMVDRSAAEKFYSVTRGVPACVTYPDRHPYHWLAFYFPDQGMLCKGWDQVQEHFLRDRAEYLVILPSLYLDWPKSELAQYAGKPYVVASDYHGFEKHWHDEAHLFDLHDDKLLQEVLGLEVTKRLAVPERVVPVQTTGEGLSEAVTAGETHFDLELDPGAILELRGRVDLKNPGELLVLAVGTPEAPAKHHLEVFGARLPNVPLCGRHDLTSIQTCFRVKDTRVARVTLAYIPSPYGKADGAVPAVEGFGAVEYESAGTVAEPRYALDEAMDRSTYHAALLSRFKTPAPGEASSILGKEWGLFNTKDATRVYLANGAGPILQWQKRPAMFLGYNRAMKIGTAESPVVTLDSRTGPSTRPVGLAGRVEPGTYRPGAVYRVTFRGWTNANDEGQVAVVYQPTSDPRHWQWVGGRKFWWPLWREYSFDFMAPPDGNIPFSVVIKEARPGHASGLIQVSSIRCTEIQGPVPRFRFWRTNPAPMVAPNDQVDFRRLAADLDGSMQPQVVSAPAVP